MGLQKDSHLVTSSKIIDELSYRLSKPTMITDLFGNEREVCQAQPFNHKSKSSACREAWFEDKKTNPFVNKPFSVAVVNVYTPNRSNYGSTIQVVTDDNFLLDLREDQLLEAIRKCGIKAGGRILGEFVWVQTATTQRLTLVGGELHKKALSYTPSAQVPGVVTAETAIPGATYHHKSLDRDLIFLGRAKIKGNEKVYNVFIDVPFDFNHYNLTQAERSKRNALWGKANTAEKIAMQNKQHATKYDNCSCCHTDFKTGVGVSCMYVYTTFPRLDAVVDESDKSAVAVRDNKDLNFYYLNGLDQVLTLESFEDKSKRCYGSKRSKFEIAQLRDALEWL